MDEAFDEKDKLEMTREDSDLLDRKVRVVLVQELDGSTTASQEKKRHDDEVMSKAAHPESAPQNDAQWSADNRPSVIFEGRSISSYVLSVIQSPPGISTKFPIARS